MSRISKDKFYTYKQSVNVVRRLGITSYSQWLKWRKAGDVDPKLPSNPATFYKDEWNGWALFFGTNNMRNSDREFDTYENVCQFNELMGHKNMKEYRAFIKERGVLNLPLSPEKYYRRVNGHFSVKEFFASKYLPYEEAKKKVIEAGFTSSTQWFKNKKERPDMVPSNPNVYYDEWTTWSDFFAE